MGTFSISAAAAAAEIENVPSSGYAGAMIRIEKVTKSYGGRPAVDGLDLSVPRGSIFGLIGPNGAGKTTTLKMVATLVKPDEGRIAVGDHELPRDVREARKVLGYMPDEFGTFRGVTCMEYLRFFGRAYGYRGAKLGERIEAVLDLTDLGPLREKLTAALSAGMRQRLSLAKTLLHDPDVLVLDEPASGLDPRARIEIRALLKELGRMGKTILISSHILADLDEICSDVAIIEAGRLVWGGSLAAARDELRRQHFDFRVVVPPEDVARAVEIIAAVPGVAKAEADDGKISLRLDGRHGNRVLEALIRGDVEVRSFTEERAHLEAIFLEQTKGTLA